MACSGEHRRVGAATCRRHGERVGGGWVGGLAEPEDGAAEAAASELDGSGEVEEGAAEGAETLPYFTVNSTAVPAYDAFCSAPVRCGKSACPGAETSTS